MYKTNLKPDIECLKEYSERFNVPIEDVIFIALNYYGVNMNVGYNRMRMAFHLNGSDELFSYSSKKDDLDYYFALPINHKSPFNILNETLYIDKYKIGKSIGATEDFCDSHYPRRLGTSLNINPNSRTSCRGCEFCYTAYQIPLDKKRMKTDKDIIDFFTNWMKDHNNKDLSHLIQVSVVTGCYDTEDDLVNFLLKLNAILKKFNFSGKIFYLGSMLTASKSINKLKEIDSFGYCMSLECFERRDILKNSKQVLSIEKIKEILYECITKKIDVNYTYVLGLEPVETFLPYMQEFIKYTTKFPTINILQLHQQHSKSLLDPLAKDLEYFYTARINIEKIFRNTSMRPLAWEDYRSLWYLEFDKELLEGPRFPEYFWSKRVKNEL